MSQIVSVDDNLVKDWLDFETFFSSNHYNPIGDDEIVYLNDDSTVTSSKVLFCAPHALNHYRHDNLKVADIFTGSLCQVLAVNTNQAGLIPICPNRSLGLLGFGDEFMDCLKKSVANGLIVIDLHGMSNDYDCDICIGTGPKPSARVSKLANRLASGMDGYKVSLNDPFDAKPGYTVTNFVQTKLNGDAVQIEISSRFRRPDLHVGDCQVFLDKVVALINQYVG